MAQRTFKTGEEYTQFLKSGGVPSARDRVMQGGTNYFEVENVKTTPEGVSFITTGPFVVGSTGERQGQGSTAAVYKGKFPTRGAYSDIPVSGVSEQDVLGFLKYNEPTFPGYQAPPDGRPVITGPRLGEPGAIPAPGTQPPTKEIDIFQGLTPQQAQERREAIAAGRVKPEDFIVGRLGTGETIRQNFAQQDQTPTFDPRFPGERLSPEEHQRRLAELNKPATQTLGALGIQPQVSVGTTSTQAAGSVVDFLKSRGFTTKAGESLFNERSQMFSNLGLDQNLGEFRGSAEQNTALLNRLGQLERDKGVSISPTNLVNFLQAGGQVQPQVQPQAQVPEALAQGVSQASQAVQSLLGRVQAEGVTDAGGQQVIAPGVQQQTPGGGFTGTQLPGSESFSPGLQDTLRLAPELLKPGFDPFEKGTITGGGLPKLDEQGNPIYLSGESREKQPKIPGAQRIGIPEPGLPGTPDENTIAQRALEMVQRGATFPLQKEAADAQKAEEQLKGQAEKEKVIQQMASKGLTFSGIREKAVANVDAETLARTLGVDRKFALLIAQGLESAAQDIAKQAQQGRKEAIDSLEALGFAINPLTGAIEPTLAARKEEGVQQRAEAADIRAEEAGERAEIRLQLAEEAAARAEQGVKLSEAERARDNARQVIGNEALYNVLSPADQQRLWQESGMSGDAPAQLTGKTSTGTFLNQKWFINTYGGDGLYAAAKKLAEDQGTSKVFKGKSRTDAIKEYLDGLLRTTDSYRKAGLTDQEILKMMMTK